MDDKISVDLEPEILEAVARRAKVHGHSVSEEVRTIVEETVSQVRGQGAWVERARAIRGMTPPGSIRVDSTRLIRASRDLDH